MAPDNHDELARFGVSLEKDLLQRFDAGLEKQHYTNRSEALRDLIRQELLRQEAEKDEADVMGTITLVYDHHVRGLAEKLISLQHDFGGAVVATVHVHADHHHCVEALMVRGTGRAVRDLADRLKSVRGVKHGDLSLVMCCSEEKS